MIFIFNGNKGYVLVLLCIVLETPLFGQACDCPPINQCAACLGGINTLTFRYNGALLPTLVIAQDASGLLGTYLVQPGGTFTVTGSLPDGRFSNDELKLKILGFVNATINTSCGTPVFQGSTYGSFTVVGGQSINGGKLCCSAATMDTSPPVILNCPENIEVMPGQPGCASSVSWTEPTANDNCGGVQLTSTHTQGASFPPGTTQVVYTATDDYGNTATCSFNVTMLGNPNPLIISGCPEETITAVANSSCESSVNWPEPTASGGCGTVTLSNNYDPGNTFGVGTTLVTYTATDGSGNSTTCSFNVIVLDNTKPVISGCSADITVTANASCQAVVNWAVPTATDNCSTVVTLTANHDPEDTFDLGTTPVTYIATDDSENFSKCTFYVTVTDGTPPVISGCSDIEAEAGENCEAVISWTLPAVVDCGSTILAGSHSPGDSFPIGITPVTYTATDDSFNTSTCTFNVKVVDKIKPVISGCSAEIEATADATCKATVYWEIPTATDNCGPVALTSTHNPGDSFPQGMTAVTYTATDGSGNVSECTFNVTVAEVAPPVLSGYADVVVAASSCEANVSWTPPRALGCGTLTMTSSHYPGDTFPIGTTEVTYIANDTKGNTAVAKFNVVVEDKTAPVFQVCSNNIVINADDGCGAIAQWTTPVAYDNCDNVQITSSHASGEMFPVGTTEVAYKASDKHGNISICKFNVIVKNDTPPVITNCPGDVQVKGDESDMASVAWIEPTGAAECGEILITRSHQPGDLFHAGTTGVVYEVKDVSGNIAYCKFNIVVLSEEIELNISKVITPDNNGINDEWMISNIDKFPDNKVVIVDRWGSVIYTASGYNNESIVWKGSNRSGGTVPTGTYFYTISVRHGLKVFERSGFIELIR